MPGYIIVDGNQGDRNNLTLWQGAEDVIRNVSSLCKNTIVVLHTVGPVLIDEWYVQTLFSGKIES